MVVAFGIIKKHDVFSSNDLRPRSCAGRGTLSAGNQLHLMSEHERSKKGGNGMKMDSYHADIVAVQQELGELDLSTGIVTTDALVEDSHASRRPFDAVF